MSLNTIGLAAELLKKVARKLRDALPPKVRDALPFWLFSRKGRWGRREYWQFGQDQRSFVFMSITRFLHINRPVPGYYFEFGCIRL